MSTEGVFILFIAAPVAWFGSQAILAQLVRPYRLRLRDGVAFLRQHATLSEQEERFVCHLWRNAYSVRASMLLCLAYVQGLLMTREAVIHEVECVAAANPNFWADKRMGDMIDWYFVSAFAANPLFGVLALVLRILWAAKVRWLVRPTMTQNVRALPPVEAAARL